MRCCRADAEAYLRVRFTTKIVPVAGILLALSGSAVTGHSPYNRHVARQDNASCNPIGRIGSGNGGRKIGFVVDISISMKDNDPKDLRFEAAAALDDALISANEAANGKTADLVTVVLFSEVPKIVYPLGDPEGAKDSLKSTPLQSGTFIGGGVQSAITELKKAGSGSTLNRTGIIVLTDGFDDPLSGKLGTIKAITSAGNEGIRVSFGFLTSELDQDKLILDAILKTGGIYSTISKPEAQESFIALVLLKGLTGIDDKGNSDNAPLLPGLSTASQLSPTGPNTFTYAAKAGETFNITVKAIDAIALHATLRDVKANTDIASQETSSTGVAFMKYTAASNMDVEVVVTASNKTTGNSSIFSVGLESSLSGGGSCHTNITNSTTPFTGNTAPLLGSWHRLFMTVFSMFGFAVAAALL